MKLNRSAVWVNDTFERLAATLRTMQQLFVERFTLRTRNWVTESTG